MPKAKVSLFMIAFSVMLVLVMLARPYTPPVAVKTAMITQGDLIKTKSFSGIVGYTEQQLCISPFDARISAVYITEEAFVNAGDLLFQLDTSLEEEMLAQLVQTDYWLLSAADEVEKSFVSALALQKSDLNSRIFELKKRIEGSQIRAEMDGVMEFVFASTGSPARCTELLGMIRSTQKCIWLTGDQTSNLGKGTVAAIKHNGITIGTAVLDQVRLAADTGEMKVRFLPVTNEMLDAFEAGDKLSVEIQEEIRNETALVPLAAVDEFNRIWVVKDGKAFPEFVDIAFRNDSFIAGDKELSDTRVILMPDIQKLKEGRAVRFEDNP